MLQALTILGAISNDYYIHFNMNATLHRSISPTKVQTYNKSTVNMKQKKLKVHKMHTLAGGAGVGGGAAQRKNQIDKNF